MAQAESIKTRQLKYIIMGSQAIQGKLWGQQSKDWASIQEQTGNTGYAYALDFLRLTPAHKLLDIGCGSGIFSSLASAKGADITGIDASEQLIDEAVKRAPLVKFITGEMEELPFADNSYDIVCGFNSFQYAANIKNAFAEAKRVLKPGGKLVVMIWGNKEDCEAAIYLKAVGSMMPPPPPGAPGPFALSENNQLQQILIEAGFKLIDNNDIVAIWDYPDATIAMKGLLSVGPAARAIENSGYQKVYDATLAAIQSYIKSSGHVVFNNKFRIIISEKSN